LPQELQDYTREAGIHLTSAGFIPQERLPTKTRRRIPKPCLLTNLRADCRRRAEAALWRAAKAESPRSVERAATALNTYLAGSRLGSEPQTI